jgi:hypothetical protein
MRTSSVSVMDAQTQQPRVQVNSKQVGALATRPKEILGLLPLMKVKLRMMLYLQLPLVRP